jgi:hypothetical protein
MPACWLNGVSRGARHHAQELVVRGVVVELREGHRSRRDVVALELAHEHAARVGRARATERLEHAGATREVGLVADHLAEDRRDLGRLDEREHVERIARTTEVGAARDLEEHRDAARIAELREARGRLELRDLVGRREHGRERVGARRIVRRADHHHEVALGGLVRRAVEQHREPARAGGAAQRLEDLHAHVRVRLHRREERAGSARITDAAEAGRGLAAHLIVFVLEELGEWRDDGRRAVFAERLRDERAHADGLVARHAREALDAEHGHDDARIEAVLRLEVTGAELFHDRVGGLRLVEHRERPHHGCAARRIGAARQDAQEIGLGRVRAGRADARERARGLRAHGTRCLELRDEQGHGLRVAVLAHLRHDLEADLLEGRCRQRLAHAPVELFHVLRVGLRGVVRVPPMLVGDVALPGEVAEACAATDEHDAHDATDPAGASSDLARRRVVVETCDGRSGAGERIVRVGHVRERGKVVVVVVAHEDPVAREAEGARPRAGTLSKVDGAFQRPNHGISRPGRRPAARKAKLLVAEPEAPRREGRGVGP